VFEVDPNTVLQWLVEAADQLQAFSRYFLHDLHLRQVQLDELYAVLSAVKEGKVSAAEPSSALSVRLTGSGLPSTGQQAAVAIDVGERTLAMRNAWSIQVMERLAPDWCAPVSHRWIQRVYHGVADALWPVGAAIASSGQGPGPSLAGCPCQSSSMRKLSRNTGADGWFR